MGIRQFQPLQAVDAIGHPFDLNYTEFTALVDTGARRTCVTDRVVQALSLKRKGRLEIWNIKRPEQHFSYMFHVGIWPETEDGTPASIFGIGEEIEGIDVGNNRYFDVLLGMDIVSQGSFRLELDGSFELAFPG